MNKPKRPKFAPDKEVKLPDEDWEQIRKEQKEIEENFKTQMMSMQPRHDPYVLLRRLDALEARVNVLEQKLKEK
jgi:polyhydroxyalkanoate synthesis regulator phasin